MVQSRASGDVRYVLHELASCLPRLVGLPELQRANDGPSCLWTAKALKLVPAKSHGRHFIFIIGLIIMTIIVVVIVIVTAIVIMICYYYDYYYHYSRFK